MRIDGLPNLQKVSQPNQRTESSRTRSDVGRGDDSVEISNRAQDAAGLTETLKAAPDVANPRIGEIRERVQSGYYNTEDVRREIAGALLDTDGIRPVVDEVVEVRSAQRKMADVPDVREDRVAESRTRAASGFYDQPDVRSQTAQSIIDESA
ncbi:MAG: flagellar biosynthesis anti-sigma factor FlgM [bacterium]|nr:flagellar biosynthesis anti-sigma factor FlgM [bacterium]